MKRVAAMTIFAVGWVLSGCSLPGTADEDGSPPLVEESPGEDGRFVVVEGGLEGPATRGDWEAATSESHVECGLDDVEHRDIADALAEEVPDTGWENGGPSEPGRCGDDYETLLYRLTNCERRARGIEPMQCDRRLVWTGRAHSRDMIDRNYFSHQTPEGRTPGVRLSDRGVDWESSSENIALAPTTALTHSGWMQSDGHRANILRSEVDRVGIGVVKSEHGYVSTALFVGESEGEQ